MTIDPKRRSWRPPSHFPASVLIIMLTPTWLLIAEMQQAQLMMVAGFVMLGWVLARRQIRMKKRVNQEARAANKELQKIRDHKQPALPLCDAPPETQRWQVALFDLQRELKAELDTRIVIVQTLLRQVDQRIERLSELEGQLSINTRGTAGIDSQHMQTIQGMVHSGHTASEIAAATGIPLGDVELTIATLHPDRESLPRS